DRLPVRRGGGPHAEHPDQAAGRGAVGARPTRAPRRPLPPGKAPARRWFFPRPGYIPAFPAEDQRGTRMPPRPRLLALLVPGLPARPAPAAPRPPADAAHCAPSPAEVREAARKDPPRQGINAVVFLEEASYTYDEKGRSDYRYHALLRIDTPAGVEDWATIES